MLEIPIGNGIFSSDVRGPKGPSELSLDLWSGWKKFAKKKGVHVYIDRGIYKSDTILGCDSDKKWRFLSYFCVSKVRFRYVPCWLLLFDIKKYKTYLVFTVVLASKSSKILGFHCCFDIKMYENYLLFTLFLTSNSTKTTCFLRCFWDVTGTWNAFFFHMVQTTT